MPEAVGDGAEAGGHRRAIDDGEDGNAQARCELGSGRRTVVKSHNPFNENQIGVRRRLAQTPRRIGFATHPQVDVVARRSAGDSVNLRVKEIRSAFEDAHFAALSRMQTGECGHDGGLSCPDAGPATKRAGQERITIRAPAWL